MVYILYATYLTNSMLFSLLFLHVKSEGVAFEEIPLKSLLLFADKRCNWKDSLAVPGTLTFRAQPLLNLHIFNF